MNLKRYIKAMAFAGAVFLAGLTAHHADAASKYGDGVLAKGSTGDAVLMLQQDLRVLGFFNYPENTGYFGELTEAAVKEFQKNHKLEENGKVGQTTGPLIADEAAKKIAQLPGKQDVVNTAMKFLGTPYAWGGNTPQGFDCSGYVAYVYGQHGIQLGRTSYDMFQQGTSVKDLQPGDLVFFSTYDSGASHVGIYVGDNKFVSATDSGVTVDSFSSTYWGPRYLGARRM